VKKIFSEAFNRPLGVTFTAGVSLALKARGIRHLSRRFYGSASNNTPVSGPPLETGVYSTVRHGLCSFFSPSSLEEGERFPFEGETFEVFLVESVRGGAMRPSFYGFIAIPVSELSKLVLQKKEAD